MAAALDFAPLDGPLQPGEAKARRAALLGGRSLLSEFRPSQGAALLALGFAWLIVIPAAIVTATASLSWLLENGATPDYLWGAPLLVGCSVVAILVLVYLTRLAFVPPRWGRWVRMQRFAEVNELQFIRTAERHDLPGGLSADGRGGVAVLTDTFVDPVTGIILGNAGAGFGTQGFVLRPGPEEEPGVDPLAPDDEPLRGFDLVTTGEGLLALRHRPIAMRSTAAIRRMFATADAVRRGDQAAIR